MTMVTKTANTIDKGIKNMMAAPSMKHLLAGPIDPPADT